MVKNTLFGLGFGVGDWSKMDANQGEPGSPDYESWLAQAREVGLSWEGGAVDIHVVNIERQKMIDEYGMAPLGEKGWTGEHGRAARLVTALRQNRPDMTNLNADDLKYLAYAIQATLIHSDGAVTEDEIGHLADIAPRIEAYTESIIEFGRMDRELPE